MFWSGVHVQSEPLGQSTPWQDEKEIINLKITMLASEERERFSPSLFTSSCLEEVWLMDTADAHYTLGKARHKWVHAMCVSVLT